MNATYTITQAPRSLTKSVVVTIYLDGEAVVTLDRYHEEMPLALTDAYAAWLHANRCAKMLGEEAMRKKARAIADGLYDARWEIERSLGSAEDYIIKP